MKSELQKESSFVRQDELLVASGGIVKALKLAETHMPMTVIRVEDEQHFGKQRVGEADIVSVEIELDRVF
ncbi:MAG: hypothetical protein ABI471_06390 [Sphingomonas bacterium]